jgi:hypothetical protein
VRPSRQVFDGSVRSSARPDVFYPAALARGGLCGLSLPPRSHIEATSGPKESALHLLEFAEMAVPILAAIFLEINALIIGVAIVCLILHEATAIWNVRYAYATREVTPTEQHVHSFLEMLPLMGLTIIAILHWGQFLALFGFGTERADFGIRLKQPPLPWLYVTVMLTLVLLFVVLPFLEEFARTLRHRGRSAPTK